MTIGRRLWDLARSELSALRGSVVDRVRGVVDEARDASAAEDDSTSETGRPRPSAGRPDGERLRHYYANLEVSPGASYDEVKSAYRRLMRRYHPDRHVADPEKVRVANEVSQQLTEAYDAICEHLEDSR